MISPKIGDKYYLDENARFDNIDTGASQIAGIEMSDEKQGAWLDGPHPYEDDPLIIEIEGLILSDPLAPMCFENTNAEIKEVAWRGGIPDHWFKTSVQNLRRL